MAKCKHKECDKEALFKSAFCWQHILYKAKYKELILRPGEDGRINLIGANLEGAFLRGANLRGANLRRAGLWGANLRGADLVGADLEGANLAGASLWGAYLLGANLEGANLTKANLMKACLLGDNLEGAILEGANLIGADLTEANLTGANLAGANLMEANLWKANLEGANLKGANLKGANLKGANLKGANLMSAVLMEADVLEADLGEANLREAVLRGANLLRADIRGANLLETDLKRANLGEADLSRAYLKGAALQGTKLIKANLTNADLRNANFNEADLTEATLTGAKVWGMSHAGCKTENIKAEYLNFDKDGKDSGIVHLNKEQAEEFFSSQPTIEILLQNKLAPYAIRTLLDLIDKINEQNPDWAVEFRKLTSSSFLSELTLKASRDEILEEVANVILGAFNKRYQQKLVEYLPEKKAADEHALMLKKLEVIENKIENPVEQVTIIHSSGEIPVNINFKESKVRVNIFGDVAKMINVEGNYYEISAPQGREDLIRNLLDQLDSPEIEKKIGEAEAQLKGLSTEQVKFLGDQFRQSVEKIFKEKQKEVGFVDRVKAFSQRFSESVFTGVISKAIWCVIEKFALPGM